MLVNATWNNTKTFKMIPVDQSSPYNEAIFDKEQHTLALVGKEKKETLHMLPKLDERGDVKTIKVGRRESGKPYEEQRVSVETFYEYFLEDRSDIESFIKHFGKNADTFDYTTHLEEAFAPPSVIQAPPLIQTP